MKEIRAGIEHSYVREEQDPQLAAFTEVLLQAPNQAKLQEAIEEVKDRNKKLGATDKRKELLGRMKESALRYHHALRDVISENPGSFSADELTEWLDMASNNEDWARQTVLGVASEVAVARALPGTAGVHEVRLASVEEDRRGSDIVIEMRRGDSYGIDVKYAWASRRLGVSVHRGRFEIGISKAMLQDFELIPEYAVQLRRDFAAAVRRVSGLR